MVAEFNTDKGLRTIDAESGTHEHQGGEGDTGIGGQEAENGHKQGCACHAAHTHAVTFSFKNVVGGPAGKQGAHNTGDFKCSGGPGGALNVEAAGFGQEFGSPVEHAHTHHIHEEVGNAEGPNPTVFPHHFHFEFFACLSALFVLVQAAESGVGKVGKTHFFRLVAQSDKHKHGGHHCQASGSIKAPFPCADVGGIGGCLFHGFSLVHTIGGKVFDDGVHHAVGLRHIRTHGTHDVAACHHSEGCTNGV